jgi:hypothetical protein
VRNEQNCRLLIAREVAQQIEDLRLHGDVERGGRLVGDEQLRSCHHCHGNKHSLALPPRQAMRKRIGYAVRVRHAGSAEPIFDRSLGPSSGFSHLAADRHRGVERAHRILRDGADEVAAGRLPGTSSRTDKFDPRKPDRACNLRKVFARQEPLKREPDACLAGTAFPDQRDDLSRKHVETDAIEDAGRAAFAAEID